MNLKSVGISALLLLIFFLMYNTLGAGITTLILAIIFLVQAILFSIKTEYHDKFLSFMNPGLYSAYSEKGSDFIRKKRRINIISYYLLSAITGFNSSMQIRLMTKIDTRHLFRLREFLPFALVILGVIFLINYISLLIMKKSKTANEDLAWNIIIGIVLAIIFIGFISFYILRLNTLRFAINFGVIAIRNILKL
jgi:hypothetical protein